MSVECRVHGWGDEEHEVGCPYCDIDNLRDRLHKTGDAARAVLDRFVGNTNGKPSAEALARRLGRELEENDGL